MSNPTEYQNSKGFRPAETAKIANPYWQTFSFILRLVLGFDQKALGFLKHVIDVKALDLRQSFGTQAIESTGPFQCALCFKSAAWMVRPV